jgi:hypothetical protein
MNMVRWLSVALVLLLALAGQPAVAGPSLVTAAGRVADVSPAGTVVIVRKTGESVIAGYRTLLWPGDRLEFRRDAVVRATVYGHSVVYTPGSEVLTIQEHDVGLFGAFEERVVEPLRRFFSEPRRAIPIFGWARDPVSGSIHRPVPGPFAPQGRLLLPRATSHLYLIWADGPARLVITAPRMRTIRLEVPAASTMVTLPPGISRAAITVEGANFGWSVEFTDRVPAPPELNGATFSEAQQLARATWLLKDGPPEWRAFAVTELADLARADNFLAGQMWTGARSGELAPLLWPER